MDTNDDEDECYATISTKTYFEDILSNLSKLLNLISINWTIEDYNNVSSKIISILFKINNYDAASITKLINYFESIYCEKVLYNNEDKVLDTYIDNLLTLHLKDAHNDIYNKIYDMIKDGKAIVNNDKINFDMTLKDFAKMIAGNKYNNLFMLYLPCFTIKDKQINQKSFEKEVSIARSNL